MRAVCSAMALPPWPIGFVLHLVLRPRGRAREGEH